MAISAEPSLDAVAVDNTNPVTSPTESLGSVFSRHAALFMVANWNSPAGDGRLRIHAEGSFDGSAWFEITHTDVLANGQWYATPPGGVLALYTRTRAEYYAGVGSATVTAQLVSAA